MLEITENSMMVSHYQANACGESIDSNPSREHVMQKNNNHENSKKKKKKAASQICVIRRDWCNFSGLWDVAFVAQEHTSA